MKAYERFLSYIKFDTKSDDSTGVTPSSEGQVKFASVLCAELRSLGIESAHTDEHSYVYCHLPATKGYEEAPCIGFIAHMDTSPDFSGKDVSAQIIHNYDGDELALGASGRTLSPDEFPHLKSFKGRTLITTDGTTLLGADDKAGVAEIMTALERIIQDDIPHGPLAVCFTPDEEIGEGADHFDTEVFGAMAAYTVDGSAEGEIEFENFNAYGAKFEVTGKNIHPGDAKDKMLNAALVAHEIVSMLPQAEIPARTEGYEGFYHLTSVSGCAECATVDLIVRDHSDSSMQHRLATLRHIEKTLCEKYGPSVVRLTLREQYRNMREVIERHAYTVNIAREVINSLGITPISNPVRGGTDGARISFMGIPCPNLGTGGFAFHGPYEHITVEGMDTCVDIIIGIARAYARLKASSLAKM